MAGDFKTLKRGAGDRSKSAGCNEAGNIKTKTTGRQTRTRARGAARGSRTRRRPARTSTSVKPIGRDKEEKKEMIARNQKVGDK